MEKDEFNDYRQKDSNFSINVQQGTYSYKEGESILKDINL